MNISDLQITKQPWPKSQVQRALLVGTQYLIHNVLNESSRLGWANRGLPKPNGAAPSWRAVSEEFYPVAWRTAYRFVRIYSCLGSELLKDLVGTRLDTLVQLERLAAMSDPQRNAHIKRHIYRHTSKDKTHAPDISDLKVPFKKPKKQKANTT